MLIDRIGGGTSINLLAPPVFALVVWNLVVYVWLLVRPLVLRGARPGPLRSLLIRLAAVRAPLTRHRSGCRDRRPAHVLAALPREWARVAAPLYGARAARVLHLAAAATALGVIAGLYTRGLAFEYRASWESTFLGAEQVHALLAVTLAPGSWLTGIPVPDVAAIEAIRAPASENAAMWMHLMAGTVAVVVIIPRLVLALVAGLVERRRAKNVALPLDEPYYRRLVVGWVGEPARVRVIPYSYTLTPEARAGLEAILARAYGNAAATIDAPVGWGDDESLLELRRRMPRAGRDGERRGRPLPLFSLTATPEDDAHGAFLDALAHGRGRGASDSPSCSSTSPRSSRAGATTTQRRDERRAVWRELRRGARRRPGVRRPRRRPTWRRPRRSSPTRHPLTTATPAPDARRR